VRYDALMHQRSSAIDRLATILRELRVARGWSLDQAAERSGISRRSLVSLEQGGGNPSLNTLLRLAEGYRVGLADLVGDVSKPTIVVRAEIDAPTLWSTERGSQARLLTASPEIELWSWDIAPGEVREGEAHRPGTAEIVHIRRGRLTVTVGPDREELGPGSVALFPGDRPHRFENLGRDTASFALMVHEPVR
jgi:transcriptional regulator with XRE-family HTH domain